MSKPNTNLISDIVLHPATRGNDGDIAWSKAHTNFFSSLSHHERQDILACAHPLKLNPRDHLFKAGDHSDNVYIVAEGCIRLLQISSTGKETILWFNFPGELFGMAEFWSASQREVYAEANETTRVYSIQRQDFVAFLGTHPEAAIKAMGILSARVRALGQTLGGLASDNVETRITRLLMRFAAVSPNKPCSNSTNNGELCVNVRLRHQDIANLIGANRQTVTTTLLRLRKLGVIRVVEHHIHIIRTDHLLCLL